MSRLKIFTDRYPLLGPVIWMLTVEYFIIQFVAAASWHHPTYSWRFNTISDLGNTVCGYSGSRLVCSPLHSLMNVSFISLGILMATGSWLIYQEFRERFGTLVGFSLMAIAGLGTILVGLFPENTISGLHSLGASLPIILGNLSLVILSFCLSKLSTLSRLYTFLSGLVPLIALGFFTTHHYLGIGIGGLERVVAYPQTVLLIFFGIYMSSNHYRQRRKAITK